MRKHFGYIALAVVAVATGPLFADSNASDTTIIVNSESIAVGSGFSHGGAAGSGDNSVVTGLTFAGGFTATHVRFEGTLTSVVPATWASEADIVVTQITPGGPGPSVIWQNPGPSGTFPAPIDYDFAFDLTGTFAGGVNPSGLGTSWNLEFIDTFDDGAGADSTSDNVIMTFEEQTGGFTDEIGNFDLGSIDVDGSASSVGEFAIANMYDLYTINLASAGLFTFSTEFDPNGFEGTTVDTEIAIFDAAGNLLVQDDDSGPGLYSGIFDFSLAAGDYTLAVAPFLAGDSFLNGPIVNPGTGTGDYIINVSLTAIPEPGSLALLGLGCCGLLAVRRRRD